MFGLELRASARQPLTSCPHLTEGLDKSAELKENWVRRQLTSHLTKPDFRVYNLPFSLEPYVWTLGSVSLCQSGVDRGFLVVDTHTCQALGAPGIVPAFGLVISLASREGKRSHIVDLQKRAMMR